LSALIKLFIGWSIAADDLQQVSRQVISEGPSRNDASAAAPNSGFVYALCWKSSQFFSPEKHRRVFEIGIRIAHHA